jgi:hypothetical protein
VIARLKEVDPLVGPAVYEPVLLSDAPRPAAFEHVPKRLRLSYALKRIAHDCLDKVEQPNSGVAISFHPVSKVLAELFVEDR